MFQFFKPPFSTKITNFTKFAVLEPLDLRQISVSKPQIWLKFSSLSPIFSKKSVLQAPIFGACTRSLSPIATRTPIPKSKFSTPQRAKLRNMKVGEEVLVCDTIEC